jgi:uncharacterized repeat protein (TIGR03803 family)
MRPPLLACLNRLNRGYKAYTFLLLWVTTAIASPASTFTTLHRFDNTDGANPNPSAWLAQATNGNFYGTTVGGGAIFPGDGTVFKITPGGTLTTLYSFCSQSGCIDGLNPQMLIQAANGNFYGTTASGGANGTGGTIFKITPGGTLTTLYSFCAEVGCPDGAYPSALVQATNGDFYGITPRKGPFDAGTIFKITPSGTLTTVHGFCSQTDCADGAFPAGLIQATDGDFYGLTEEDGAFGHGTVFKITASGTLTTLYSFCPLSTCLNGGPDFGTAGLVQASNGDFYGTTGQFGANGFGTVFRITPSGTLKTIYSFCAQAGCPDGFSPSGLVQGSDGNLYGSTSEGGANGYGTIFKITPAGTLTTLYSFICSASGCPNGQGALPSWLIQDTNGAFYGTTSAGGLNSCDGDGCGTVFSLSVGLAPFVETKTTSGKVGAAVEILGTKLTGATSVTFNGTAAVFTVVSGSLIMSTVPTGASTGFVTVTTPSGRLTSNQQFRVTP